jgi:hypothetical protein
MVHLKAAKWVAAASATACFIVVMGVGAGPAGASSGVANRSANGAVIAGTYPVRAGTYEWYFNGSADGTITLSLGNTFTDSGTWVQAGNAVGLAITGGTDALAGCVFAGRVQEMGSAISSAAKPGDFARPGYQEDGTFYIAPASARPSAAPAHGSALVRSGATSRSDGSFVLGTYRWTEDDSDTGRIAIAWATPTPAR